MNYSRSIGKETPTFLLKGSREGLIKKRISRVWAEP